MSRLITRRGLLGATAAGLALSGLMPAWARSGSPGLGPAMPLLSGNEFRLRVGHSPFSLKGRTGHAITLNGVLPAPLIRLREGQRVRIHVENGLDEDTSIHWHGLLVPFEMDGVPGVSFPGIPAGATFTYDFSVIQSGTYWYHSHSGLQEQMGHYGPMIIDPDGADPVEYDREHVLVLSDWSFMHPHEIFTRLKQKGGFFNRQKQTIAGRLRDAGGMTQQDRAMFAGMRMDPTDIADVTGAAYDYLINGHGQVDRWTGLFSPGERVRLRIINAAAQTIFNFRIPGLPLTVVAADGQNVRPVTVDEFQIGNAETYDIIVQPDTDQAFSVVAESIDRSGMAVATLAPRMGMSAPVPMLRERPLLGMKDMGMDHGAHGGAHAHAASGEAKAGHDEMDMRDESKVAFDPGVGVDMISPNPVDRTGEPGIGLEDVGHRVLTYRDLVSLAPRADRRVPSRNIEIHLTGNMERFMWSIDGEKLSERPEPYRLARNERVRLTLINDTMMTHPMHLHGHFFEIVNGHGAHQPFKHTVMVLPGGKVSLDLTADAPGDWAFHCHMLYHMHAGMMRVVTVRPLDGGAA
ncbi:copper resistance system multicopper oxidase [Emcibacter sp. SYSU 3D8]|uniref:copper resistance system multicopper oxidase n=1 Tax=Emcibacter sp. SYSU 3D8 TaxID=3133969 RepID=UPI0031FEABB9